MQDRKLSFERVLDAGAKIGLVDSNDSGKRKKNWYKTSKQNTSETQVVNNLTLIKLLNLK
jgi:hypothetical protein